MSAATLGSSFEQEIREQPAVWERLARSDIAASLARAVTGEVVLVGSGSSLFVAQLGALALRRRNVDAHALAATEARLDHAAYQRKIVVAISQSGRSTDLLAALDMLHPKRIVALTNTARSPLGDIADLVLDVGAGIERAVPASKSVTASVVAVLWAASIVGGHAGRDPQVLSATAQDVERWLQDGPLGVREAAEAIARRQHVAVLGSDYGLPVAREVALKLKEASYLHAEGFSAGEFRHGSVSMVDDSFTVIGIADRDAVPAVARPLHDLERSGALRYEIGTSDIAGVPKLGPAVKEAYNTLGWLVTGQLLALYAARARGIDCDAPRGLTKALVEE
ncbi:MAG TPA: SIS domain-containing protein [Candidatus Acidoferrales bacterium]|nr:SIS domain-containing protein [Candidatus Acidoferrales bacterium]